MDAYAPDLLQTKLAIPLARADRVSRLRLVQQLDKSLQAPLTLICAPAGFGKTSLITDWYEQPDAPRLPLAWLSLDEDDNDPTRFLMYLLSALQNLGGIAGDDLLTSLQSQQPPSAKVILTILLRRIEDNPQRFALVLDDYHRITAAPLQEAVGFLLDHIPAQMRLVITSRDDPLLPLARLRARGQLAEIRADDLRFTPEETDQFLEQMLGIELSADQIRELDARTEGWIAGLQLAALAMQGRKDIAGFITAFTGSHRYILDYLTEEVLNRQPEAIQRFLLQTSILKRLSSSLCDAVTGRTDSQEFLEQIERGNLFLIPLDDERYWYRYHHLFSDMLQRRLQQSGLDPISELHRRASIWFDQNKWISEAVEHALMAQDTDRAAQLLEQHGENVWKRGELATVMRCLETLPEEALYIRPKLGLNYAFMLMLVDAFVEAEQLLSKVEKALAVSDMEAAARTAFLGQAAAIRATVSVQLEYDVDITLAAGRQALAQLPESDIQWRGWVTMVIGMAQFESNSDLAATQNTLENAIRLGEKANDLFTVLIARAHLSTIYMIQGKLGQVEINCQRLLRYTTELGRKGESASGFARLDRSWVRYERNDLEDSYEDVMEGRKAVQDYKLTLRSKLNRLEKTKGSKS